MCDCIIRCQSASARYMTGILAKCTLVACGHDGPLWLAPPRPYAIRVCKGQGANLVGARRWYTSPGALLATLRQRPRHMPDGACT